MKHIFSLILISILFLFTASISIANAEVKHARASASLKTESVEVEDNRAEILEAFLRKYNSPFADQAEIFVREADKNDLDWKFVAAISGIESTFGQRYPEGTYNAWGWGIYGTNMHYFMSWEDAITTISSELRTRYMDQWGATNTYEIGRYYAANPTWASKVEFFMSEIAEFETEYNNSQLSIII